MLAVLDFSSPRYGLLEVQYMFAEVHAYVFVPSSTKVQEVAVTLTLMWAGAWESHFKDCLTHLFHGFRNRHFNKISLDNTLYFHY